VEVTIDTSTLDRLLASVPNRFAQVLAMGSFEVEALAKMTAPVDTGALANSIKAVKVSDYFYKIGPSVEYAIHQEMGWTDRSGRVHPGRWYMTNALLGVAPRIYEAVRQMFGGSGMGGSGFYTPKVPGEGK
jgi:hypothetical protein